MSGTQVCASLTAHVTEGESFDRSGGNSLGHRVSRGDTVKAFPFMGCAVGRCLYVRLLFKGGVAFAE